MIDMEWNNLFNLENFLSSVEKFGYASKSSVILITSMQFVPNRIVRVWDLRPSPRWEPRARNEVERVFVVGSALHTTEHPLPILAIPILLRYCHLWRSMHHLPCICSSTYGSRVSWQLPLEPVLGGNVSFGSDQSFASACLTVFGGSLEMPLNNFSFLAFQMNQIIHGMLQSRSQRSLW